ncbi:MAG: hypothetical protein KJO46_06330 [Gammaproteobacteria bacterium]|nr:hypothetical protein [Gammaproteobacteria bacterium]
MDHIESVESAITRVLRAEQEALAAIEASEGEAKEIQRQARQAARAVLHRTRQRVSRLHVACATRTRELIDEIERGAAAPSATSPEDGERQLLDAAIRALATELTSRSARDAD